MSTSSAIIRDALRAAKEELAILEDAAAHDLTPEACLQLLAELGRRQGELRMHLSLLAEAVGLPSGAKDRLLRYLLLTKGKVVDKDELSGVSGIYEWARRLRELRLEDGWAIASDESRQDLRPGQYVLRGTTPDLDLRDRWRLANSIRRSSGSATDRLAAFFRANVGKVVSGDELYYVSRIHSYPRRIRELTEDGWKIDSSLDRPDLQPGDYLFSGDITPPTTQS